VPERPCCRLFDSGPSSVYAGGPSRLHLFSLKQAAAAEVHRAACSPQATSGHTGHIRVCARGLPLPGRSLNYPNGNAARLLHCHARDW